MIVRWLTGLCSSTDEMKSLRTSLISGCYCWYSEWEEMSWSLRVDR